MKLDADMRYVYKYVEDKDEYYKKYAKLVFANSGFTLKCNAFLEEYIYEPEFVIDEVFKSSKFRNCEFFKEYIKAEFYNRIEQFRVGICRECGTMCMGKSLKNANGERGTFGRTDYNWEHKVCTNCSTQYRLKRGEHKSQKKRKKEN